MTDRLTTNMRALVVVPYRNRKKHLDELLPAIKIHMSDINSHILIIEQSDSFLFNKAMLLNAGFDIATKNNIKFDYCIFHDVDFLPVNVDYSFPRTGAAQLFKQSENVHWSEQHFGGVVAVSRKSYLQVNGSSNGYWGWGSEDYDLRDRLKKAGFRIESRSGQFKVLEHPDNGWNGVSGNKLPKRNLRRYIAVRNGFIKPEEDGVIRIDYRIVNEEKDRDYSKYSVTLSKNKDKHYYRYAVSFIKNYIIERITIS